MRKFFRLPSLLTLCFIISALASVSVKAASITITRQPHDTTVCSGTISFIVAANDTPGGSAITAQWQVSTDGGTSWSSVGGTNYTGVTTDTLKITNDSLYSGNKYRVVLTNTIGSVTSSPALLTVIRVPHVGRFAAPSRVCPGSSITLVDTPSGGVWTSTNTRIATVGSLTGIVTGVASGMDSIFYTITNMCGTAKAFDSLKVDTLPTVGIITGAHPICRGTNDTLTDTVRGGVWSSSNNAIGTVDTSGMVTGLSQGFDTIKYTITNGLGCANTTSIIVRIDTPVTSLPITGPNHICSGDSIRLMNGNVLGTWVWNASNTDASVSHNGWVHALMYGINGMDTIHYTFANSCNSVDTTFTVHIDTLVSPGTISGPSSVCAGSFITLTESTIGGYWQSSDNAVAAADAFSGVVTGYTQGTATITYRVFSGSCGSSYATHLVTVYDYAAAITGPDSVGVGATISLSDVTVAGTWSISDTSKATISASGVVTGVATGTAIVTYSVTNTCGTTASTYLIYIGHPPVAATISGFASVCIGHTIALSASVPGGSWSMANSYATISNTGVVTGVSTGGNAFADSTAIDYAYYVLHNAFGSDTTTYQITVRHTPILQLNGPSIVAIGGDYYIGGMPYGGTWRVSNSSVGTIVAVIDSSGLHEKSQASFIMLTPGVDTIHYTYTNACGTTDSIFVVQIRKLGINSLSGNISALNVYPNPSKGDFTINMPSATSEQVSVTIANIVGEKVKEVMINTNEPFNVKLDEPAGIYFLTAITSDGKFVAKINISK